MQTPEQSKKQLLDYASATNTVDRLKELLVGIESIHERSDTQEVIEQTLVIVQENFYLVPKVSVGDIVGVIEHDRPEEAITEPLYELWNFVSSECPVDEEEPMDD